MLNSKMYASVSRARNNLAEPSAKSPASMAKSSNSAVRTPVPARAVRNATPTANAPTMRSKFTERKAITQAPPAHATASANGNAHRIVSSKSNSQQPTATTNRNASAANERARKPLGPTTSTPMPKRAWGGRNIKESHKSAEQSAKACEKVDPLRFSEIGVQTNEPEIVDYDLLIGDIKFMLPSKPLVIEIDRGREEARKKLLLKAQRQYEEHSEKQAEHLADLKEFLEKATITKKPRKPHGTLELDRKLISSMDEILNKEVPKTESIADIKSRIKKKERELLTLFETVENIQIFSNKNS